MKKLLAFIAAAGFSLSAVAAPEVYVIDGSHTFPRFEYTHMGFSTQQSRFNNTTGKVTLDRAAKTGAVEVLIDTKSVDTGFDVFNDPTGQKLPADRKSVAYRFQYRAPDRTLKAEEVDAALRATSSALR